MNITNKVIEVVREISSNIEESDEELIKADYLERGLIDSFQIVEMISKLEEAFNITFSPEDFESDKFRTLRGVVELIENHRSGIIL